MEEEKTLNQVSLSDDFGSKKVSPYELLMRQSRKMGGLATRTYDVTKEFLKQDVSTLHPDKVLFGGRASAEKQTESIKDDSDDDRSFDDQDISSKGGLDQRGNSRKR